MQVLLQCYCVFASWIYPIPILFLPSSKTVQFGSDLNRILTRQLTCLRSRGMDEQLNTNADIYCSSMYAEQTEAGEGILLERDHNAKCHEKI